LAGAKSIAIAGEVLRDGAEQRLPRKAFDLLLVLLDRTSKVVAKDALIKPCGRMRSSPTPTSQS
jgi:DNA-binding winged helix-turn-helix (wHTH) protein